MHAIHACMPCMHAFAFRFLVQQLTKRILLHKITMPFVHAWNQCMHAIHACNCIAISGTKEYIDVSCAKDNVAISCADDCNVIPCTHDYNAIAGAKDCIAILWTKYYNAIPNAQVYNANNAYMASMHACMPSMQAIALRFLV